MPINKSAELLIVYWPKSPPLKRMYSHHQDDQAAACRYPPHPHRLRERRLLQSDESVKCDY